ncbi:MAG: XRE family transcriptional regulator [Christensenellaceae bacterium]|nr:XRE family transcriptional regulator [Christensenellaceae bacterium]
MNIGDTIKQYRLKLGLTQEELASRTELSKGFISQLERNLTSPSIATLTDILEALGTNLSAFFSESAPEKAVFTADDVFIKEDIERKFSIAWLVPNAQKNDLEPILVTLEAGGETALQDPHEGEEFGYVLSGSVLLYLGDRQYRVRRGESFSFVPTLPHHLKNAGKIQAKVLWVATPPSF